MADSSDALSMVIDRTSVTIATVRPTEAVLWRFARCWLTVVRLDTCAAAPDTDVLRAVTDLNELPPELPGRPALAVALDAALARRGIPASPAVVAGTTATQAADPSPDRPPITAAELRTRALALQSAILRGDLANPVALMNDFRMLIADIDRLPPHDPLRRSMAGMRDMMAPLLNPTGPAGSQLVDDPAGMSPQEWAAHQVGRAGAEFKQGTPDAHHRSTEILDQVVSTAAPDDPQLPYYLLTAGTARLGPPGGAPTHEDIATGIALLERARDAAGSPVHQYWILCAVALAGAYRNTSRVELSRRVALSGLDGYVWQTLLASEPAELLATAQKATTSADEIALMCLADGDTEGAVRAWEIGRGMRTYAATETRDLDTRLRATGDARLARRWEQAVASAGPFEVPAALRAEVLHALTGAAVPADGVFRAAPGGGDTRLLDVPTLPEVRAALAAHGLDMLVYLVMTEPGSMTAVLVPVDEPPFRVVLPVVTSTSSPDGLRAVPIEPLLTGHLADRTDRPVRIALAPVGALADVQWHETDQSARAVFTYPGSARLLCDSAWQVRKPIENGGST